MRDACDEACAGRVRRTHLDLPIEEEARQFVALHRLVRILPVDLVERRQLEAIVVVRGFEGRPHLRLVAGEDALVDTLQDDAEVHVP